MVATSKASLGLKSSKSRRKLQFLRLPAPAGQSNSISDTQNSSTATRHSDQGNPATVTPAAHKTTRKQQQAIPPRASCTVDPKTCLLCPVAIPPCKRSPLSLDLSISHSLSPRPLQGLTCSAPPGLDSLTLSLSLALASYECPRPATLKYVKTRISCTKIINAVSGGC